MLVALPFAAWQTMTPATAAREVHARVAGLPDALRSAALAWLTPEHELSGELEAVDRAPTDTATSKCEEQERVPSLRGVPYFLKDLFDVAGIPTRAGSTFLDRVRSTPGDSTWVRRLREWGAAFAGKTQLVEFASGLTGENPHYGDCPQPRFPQRLSGGSSSGSAALVAAGVVPLAIGTDTGGSVRVPAAWCGVYGFRLTPGDELIRDAFPLAPTMDTAGWFTANAMDMRTAWQTIVGRPREAPRQDAAPEPLGSRRALRGCYLPASCLLPSIDPVLDTACELAAAQIAERADLATQASFLSSWQEAVEAYLTIGMSEAFAVHRDWLATYAEHYDPMIWKRFTDAEHLPAEKIVSARASLEQVRRTWTQFFESYDFLVLPSVPTPAPTKAECTPELRRRLLTLTAPASLGGLPCLSTPVTLPSGLSAGLQVIASRPSSSVFGWVLSNLAQ